MFAAGSADIYIYIYIRIGIRDPQHEREECYCCALTSTRFLRVISVYFVPDAVDWEGEGRRPAPLCCVRVRILVTRHKGYYWGP